MRWRFPGLTLKLLVALVGTMALISGAQGFFFAYRHERDLEQVVMQAADRIVDLVRRSARSAMLDNNSSQLHEMMQTIGSEPGMVRLRIFNREGMIMYSTEKAETGTQVDKQAEACTACHAQDKPMARLARPDRIRIFKERDGSRTMGIIMPIENERACWEADCHAHGPGEQVLGVLDVNLTLKDIDRSMRDAAVSRLVAIVGTIVLVSLVVILFILIWVSRPLKKLTDGTKKLAGGDLDHTISISSHDEMGTLALAFNDMARRLKESMQVIQHWNETLQKKVDQKSEELKQANDHLLKVERMATLGRLAAIVAHEINNPLSGIRTYAKLLKKKGSKANHVLSEEDVRYLGLMESEAARCGDIVKGLLEFSRNAPIRLQKHDISALAEESVRLVQHRFDLQSVEVKKDLKGDLPEFSCSSQQVVQSLIAILINACEAMPNEGVLSISTGIEPDSTGVWVKIQDSGVGMDDATIEHIFEPFFTTKEEGRGVGLGLAVVYGIVHRHGGRIDVSSRPKQGSCFTLHFPLEPPPGLAEEIIKENVS